MPDRLYLRTESRAVPCDGGLALAHSPSELRPVGPLAGHVAAAAELAREHGFTDLDGTQPATFELPE